MDTHFTMKGNREEKDDDEDYALNAKVLLFTKMCKIWELFLQSLFQDQNLTLKSSFSY